MKRVLQVTADGSYTIALKGTHNTYHSIHGAMQESRHVYMTAGLQYVLANIATDSLNILEMGLGTGLNALLSFEESNKTNRRVYYKGIELYPLTNEEILGLNYAEMVDPAVEAVFPLLHSSQWEQDVMLGNKFTFHKSRIAMQDWQTGMKFHLIYYDAFAPDVQPELWTQALFEKMYHFLMPGGVLVTYCSKGAVRRAMQVAGFKVEKLVGPPGKREIIRAIKYL